MLLALTGFVMIGLLMYFLLKGKAIPVTLFVVLPIIGALINGFGIADITDYIKSGVSTTWGMAATTGVSSSTGAGSASGGSSSVSSAGETVSTGSSAGISGAWAVTAVWGASSSSRAVSWPPKSRKYPPTPTASRQMTSVA